ncbi:MAG: OmpA family protein, partial [Dongiaceae bacterium]
EGLSGASGGTQYGEPLVGGPSSSAERPAAPPPPEPAPEEQLPPIPEAASVETQSSEAPSVLAPAAAPEESIAAAPDEAAEAVPDETVADAPAAVTEPMPTPEVAEPEPPQVAEAVPAPDSAAPDSGSVQAAPMAPMVMEQQQPVAPVGTQEDGSQPFQPEAQLALAPGSAQATSLGATRQPAVLPPYQPYNPAQAMYRSPYASASANYGGANYSGANYGVAVVSSQSAAVAPTPASYGQPAYGGEPVGLIYFQDGSSSLSSDDRPVLKQIADMQRIYGGIVHVVGHASMRTSSIDFERHQQANQRISEARANAVARQLVEYGVPRDAIQTAAAGDSQPLYSEIMPSGEAANRRAEVYLSAY